MSNFNNEKFIHLLGEMTEELTKNFATEEDIKELTKNFATEEDIKELTKNFATEEDIKELTKNFATEEDIKELTKNFATEEDIKDIEGISGETISKEVLDNIERSIVNKPDFSQYQDYTIINVKEHGVKGDGVTNDILALKEIFSNVQDYSVIYFPTGTYLLGDKSNTEILLKISNKKYVKIIGHSVGDTKLIAHPQAPATNNMGMLHLYRTEHCTVENLEIDGNSQQRHIAFGGTNWGDESTKMANCSNICVDGANHTVIRNVYSHHPLVDCIETSRYAGGDTPNNHHLLIEDCILDYGYRQGLSIVGTDHGIIRNCRITNTAKALNLYLNDGTSTIGTSPMAGIDSETWVWNHDWVIENCYFENNKGLHINMNDGGSEHIIKDNYFIGGGIVCETPSSGTRTLNNIITNNRFINSGIGSLHGSFNINNNIFQWNDLEKITGAIVSLTTKDSTAFDRIGASIFTNNRIAVRLDEYIKKGIDLKNVNLYCAFGKNVIVTNNAFHNLLSPNPLKINNSSKAIISDNEFTSCYNLKNIITETAYVRPSEIVLNNNIVDDNYPSFIRRKLNNTLNANKFNKNGDKYCGTKQIGLYTSRKYFLPITKFENMTYLKGKIKISANNKNGKNALPSPIDVEYDIIAYKDNNNIIQKGKFNNVFDCESHLITCNGFEVIDGVVYLGISNEYTVQYTATIDFEFIDESGGAIEVMDLQSWNKFETVVSEIPVKIEAREYIVGETVRSFSSGGGIYLYEVTTGGIITSPTQMHYAKNYAINGVVFTYKGYYQGNKSIFN